MSCSAWILLSLFKWPQQIGPSMMHVRDKKLHETKHDWLWLAFARTSNVLGNTKNCLNMWFAKHGLKQCRGTEARGFIWGQIPCPECAHGEHRILEIWTWPRGSHGQSAPGNARRNLNFRLNSPAGRFLDWTCCWTIAGTVLELCLGFPVCVET
jgi:hypothetical protein